MNRIAKLTAVLAATLILAGCTADAGSTVPSAGAAGAPATAAQKAKPLGPPETNGGRVKAGDSVPTPSDPFGVSSVFCSIADDGQITEYRARQISGFAAAATAIAKDEAHFTKDMGFTDRDQALSLGKKFAKVGAELESLTQDRNVSTPPNWDERIGAYCADPLTD